VDVQPDFAPAYEAMGRQLHREGRFDEAAVALEKAAILAPSVENLLLLARALQRTVEFERSELYARQALGLVRDSAAAHVVLANALFGQRKYEEGERHIASAKELDTTGSEAFQIATALRQAGNILESNVSLRRAIQFDPLQVSPYALLMHNVKVSEQDRPLVEQMRSLARSERISPVEKSALHYGLGKALEDLGEYEESMTHYDEANRLTRATKLGNKAFDEAGFAKRVDMLIEATSRDVLSQNVEGRSESELPILIVGMARSGTTLAEQILSSHPLVEAAGEHPFWTGNWTRALSDSQDSFVPEQAAALGKEYVKILGKFGPSAARITDKMPGNGMVAGLIHLSLPNARLIHMRRSPIDNGLSIWKTPNVAAADGAHEKRGVVFVYKQYLRLVEHWRAAIPPERFLEVDYEELVSEPERVTREIVAFCGLEWDEACLRPEENQRSVVTPSSWQVRQPVYRTSVDRWRKFEPWLGELTGLLELKHPPKVKR
jgi:tetratricopeptide (TPR) repeat protein